MRDGLNDQGIEGETGVSTRSFWPPLDMPSGTSCRAVSGPDARYGWPGPALRRSLGSFSTSLRKRAM